MNDEALAIEISKYKFYHTIPLTDRISTPGNKAFEPAQNLCLQTLRSLDLKGKRVLDIGCRDGLFSFAAESLGAAEIIGIDNDVSLPAREFLIPFLKSRVVMHEMNLYDLRPETFGLFDVVIFPGVLYHLRYPSWGLKAIRDVMAEGGHLITETPIWREERNNALLFCPTGEASPYEPTSPAFFNEKGLVDTLDSLGFKTLRIDYVKEVRPLKSRIRRLKTFLRTVLSGGHRPPIRRVQRGAFLSRFLGVQMESHLMRYWESTHEYHTLHGA